jgi:hypothetical protein
VLLPEEFGVSLNSQISQVAPRISSATCHANAGRRQK